MFSFLVTLFCLLFVVQASPLSLESRAPHDVFVPKIISPNSSTVWKIGGEESVEWYVNTCALQAPQYWKPMNPGSRAMPPRVSRMALLSCWVAVRVLSVFRRSLFLTSSPYLADNTPLVVDFDLRAGHVSFRVPGYVLPGYYYITRESVLLENLIIIWAYTSADFSVFGDSGNRSQLFLIKSGLP